MNLAHEPHFSSSYSRRLSADRVWRRALAAGGVVPPRAGRPGGVTLRSYPWELPLGATATSTGSDLPVRSQWAGSAPPGCRRLHTAAARVVLPRGWGRREGDNAGTTELPSAPSCALWEPQRGSAMGRDEAARPAAPVAAHAPDRARGCCPQK